LRYRKHSVFEHGEDAWMDFADCRLLDQVWALQAQSKLLRCSSGESFAYPIAGQVL